MAIGELTGDEFEDAVVAMDSSGKLVLIRGRADGELGVPAAADVHQVVDPLIGYPRPTAVGVEDVDGDGDLDVAAGFGTSADMGVPPNTSDSGTVSILTNDGAGALSAAGPTLPVNAPSELHLLMLAGDDDPDLLVAQANKPAAQAIKVFPGGAGATFQAPTNYPSGGGAASSVDWGDFNEDGRIDLAIAHEFKAYPNVISPVDVVLGGASATLLAPVSIAGSAGNDVAVGDLDRDGHDDVYLSAGQPLFYSAPALPVFIHGRGDGGFGTALRAQQASFANTAEFEYAPVIDDLDGDGWPDVLARGGYDGGYVLRYGVGPQIEPDPAEIDFGGQVVGTRSTARTLRFVNTGPGTASAVAILHDSASNSGDFPIVDDACSQKTLGIGDSCTIAVAFAPAAAGDREALLAAAGAESDTVIIADLYGTGTAPPAPAPGPSATPAPTSPNPTAPEIVPARAPHIATASRRSLSTSGLRFTQRFLRPGSARWTLEASGPRAGKRIVLGRAAKKITAPGRVRVTLRLSKAGRRYLARHRKASLRLRTAFAQPGAKTFVLTTKVRLRR
jgi:hypothetical protein